MPIFGNIFVNDSTMNNQLNKIYSQAEKALGTDLVGVGMSGTGTFKFAFCDLLTSLNHHKVPELK